MKKRVLALLAILALVFCCNKPEPVNNDDNNDPKEQTDTTSTNPPAQQTEEDELPTEIKDGDVLLVTNDKVEKFILEVNYPERDYSETHIRDEVYGPTCPGNSDKPKDFTIRWKADATAGDPVVRIWEDLTGWSREYTNLVASDYYQKITNLIPNDTYHFEVKAGDKVLNSGTFTTTGHVRQLFFYHGVRNMRDLGGWQTKDGRTIKYRKIYRSGRLEPAQLNSKGIKDVRAEGILAQLDLRGTRDVLSASPFEEFAFCAPIIEEGYSQLLRDDQEKARQCMEFIFQCVRDNKPVDYHCSLGRDRTGTITMLILGILGVDEGIISKEYELTQFAPHGWSTSDGEKTKMTRRIDYRGAAEYIWNNFTPEGGSFKDGVNAYFLHIGLNQADIDEFCKLMLDGEPKAEAPIKIDGNMADWDKIETGLADESGPYYAFKATFDDDNIYVYSKRDFRNTYWADNGYFYYDFDLDNNPETGVEKDAIVGLETWMYLRPFGGTNDAPAINTTPKGERYFDGKQASYTLPNNGCAGVIGEQIVEVEMVIPRADVGVKAGDTIRIYSWCNKDGGNLKSQYISLTL